MLKKSLIFNFLIEFFTSISANMKLKIPMPAGGTGVTLFSKLIRTKDLRSLQGEDPRSTKPKLTVSNSAHRICNRSDEPFNLVLSRNA